MIYQLLFLSTVTVIAAESSWITVVLTDFQLKKHCVESWNFDGTCQNPSVRLLNGLPNGRFSSVSWPLDEKLMQGSERRFFTTQWKEAVEQINFAVQIDSENVLAPFGLRPICDRSAVNVTFSEESNSRSVQIESTCFTARALVKLTMDVEPIASAHVEERLPRFTEDDLLVMLMFLTLISTVAVVLLFATICVYKKKSSIPSTPEQSQYDVITFDRMAAVPKRCSAPSVVSKSMHTEVSIYDECDDVIVEPTPKMHTSSPKLDSGVVSLVSLDFAYDNWTMNMPPLTYTSPLSSVNSSLSDLSVISLDSPFTYRKSDPIFTKFREMERY